MIRINNLHISYQRGNQKIGAINGVSLDLNDNDFTALIGHAGSGKSTLLGAISGLIEVEKGEIYLGKQRLSQMKRSTKAWYRGSQFAIIFQFSELINRYTIEENLLLSWRATHGESKSNGGNSESRFRERLAYICENLPLNELLSLYPYQISGGQLQIAAIARALIKDVPVILADEPSGDLDPQNMKKVATLFQKEHKAGKTILLVTHDMGLAMNARTVYEIKDGKIDKLVK